MMIEEKTEKSPLGTTKETILTNLAIHGITNGAELQQF
jgi:hypothetical protein